MLRGVHENPITVEGREEHLLRVRHHRAVVLVGRGAAVQVDIQNRKAISMRLIEGKKIVTLDQLAKHMTRETREVMDAMLKTNQDAVTTMQMFTNVIANAMQAHLNPPPPRFVFKKPKAAKQRSKRWNGNSTPTRSSSKKLSAKSKRGR
jgi:hypothetical protein